METYKDWQVFSSLPAGWKIDKTAGSPLNGYEFATNGKSIFNGQKRALVKYKSDIEEIHPDEPVEEKTKERVKEKPHTAEEKVVIAKTVNDLARAKFKERMLNDILVDLTICEIEGWSKTEYIDEMKLLINSLPHAANQDC